MTGTEKTGGRRQWLSRSSFRRGLEAGGRRGACMGYRGGAPTVPLYRSRPELPSRLPRSGPRTTHRRPCVPPWPSCRAPAVIS
eukprot:359132-Chlamydomonas_euryale.AAC.6